MSYGLLVMSFGFKTGIFILMIIGKNCNYSAGIIILELPRTLARGIE
jgi:hypothetical protein